MLTPEHRGNRVGLRVLALFLFLALAALGLGQSTTDPFLADAISDPPFESLTYGIQAFLWWDATVTGLRLDAIRTMVFSHVKQTFAWEDIEPLQDEWHFQESDRILDELERRGMKLVARLTDTPGWALDPALAPDTFIDSPPANPADYANYCGAVASRYRGRIAAYQIWNEPNLSREWGNQTPSAAGYVGLLKACSEAIRAADPSAILISAGLSPTGTYDDRAHPDDIYLQAMYDAGFEQYVDVVGVHAPGFSPPERSPDRAVEMGSQRFFTFRRVEDLRKIMVANGDAARQMAILETGWTRDDVHADYAWFAVPEKVQARHLVAAYQYAADYWRPWVGLMSAIYVADPSWGPKDEEYYWSVLTPEGYQTLAYPVLANMPKYCGSLAMPERDPGSPEAVGQAPIVFCSER